MICNFFEPKDHEVATDFELRIGPVWRGKIIYLNVGKPMVCNFVGLRILKANRF